MHAWKATEVTDSQDKRDLGPLVTAWLNEVDADTTRANYERSIGWFVDWLDRTHPGLALVAVSRPVAAEYAAHVRTLPGRRGPLGPSARAARLSVVSAFYRYLVRSGVVQLNPLDEMPRPKVDRGGRTPAREEADVDAMWDCEPPLRDALVVGLLAGSGLRVMELVRADVSDLHTDGGRRLISCRVKGGKRRNVPVPAVMLDPVAEYVGTRAKGPLILADDGERLTRDKVACILRRVAREAGVADPSLVRPHVLRTSLITNLLERGRPIQDVQAMVGHSSAETTARYWRRRTGLKRDGEMTDEITGNMKPRRALLLHLSHCLKSHAPKKTRRSP